MTGAAGGGATVELGGEDQRAAWEAPEPPAWSTAGAAGRGVAWGIAGLFPGARGRRGVQAAGMPRRGKRQNAQTGVGGRGKGRPREAAGARAARSGHRTAPDCAAPGAHAVGRRPRSEGRACRERKVATPGERVTDGVTSAHAPRLPASCRFISRVIFSKSAIFKYMFKNPRTLDAIPGSPLGPGGPMSPESPFSPEKEKRG